MKDLWEQVQVYNVNAGDVIMINTYGHPARIDASDIDKYGGIPSLNLHREETVFRRVPASENPRVLRRALEKLAWKAAGTHYSADPQRLLNEAIELARKELESEGIDG